MALLDKAPEKKMPESRFAVNTVLAAKVFEGIDGQAKVQITAQRYDQFGEPFGCQFTVANVSADGIRTLGGFYESENWGLPIEPGTTHVQVRKY